MQAIRLEEVSKQWGEARAVDRVTFEAEPGSLVVLLGPSGCGKSTTLRLIAGLEQVDTGRVLIDGRDVTALPPSQRRLAMVFQSYALFPHLSVAENILFGLTARRVARTERARRLARAAELLGLGGLLERKPGQLSGGQQQRVALGRAIVAEQPLCLMDEPLSNLDAQLRQEMRHEIRALQQSLGMTLLYVTHDQAEAMSMADRVILMNQGRIEQDAAPAELYDRPASLFAARFIGTPPMNLLPLADGPGGAVVRGTAGPPLFAGGGEGLALGLRPETVTLAGAAEEGLATEVLAAEYLGADSIVALRAGEARLSVRLAGRIRPQPGEPLRVTWPGAAAHLFDLSTGRRLDEAAGIRLGAVRRRLA
ncbi:carbohydrate ABC transporter ATP-binding protein, CUT1 family [Tistlia consotensis]|uniref:Carbohydrate ABC transporter ATP-binding protein, CUT1 family n=1 Tax=Tistlia consotensis USBA 355 TaxID=560819 RepID=A0A1Y6CRG6_9PROT|nr:ABC transporter ATP-binding protein [Tistlia consotensis]SMF73727.1 carbohydrate ABC transporter ATP-binding protein, CUT1 family [Tistlia consotensis USBA 355]SNS28604.1 carbohydrate ABC transporter ATP-binding protein, CUT1 family [Tistlia consotensis]